tara:strand:- start:9210 stop:10394 length:1185 start_codon:yes stop_codon:yes gene_type:complete
MPTAHPRPSIPGWLLLCLLSFTAVAAVAQEQSGRTVSVDAAEDTQNIFLLRKLLTERQFRFFGRVEGDIAHYDIPLITDETDYELRRFRLGLIGLNPWFENLSYKVEIDLTDGSSTLSSAYVIASFGDNGSFTIGNQDGSQSLSASTGSLSQLFMEEPLPIQAFGLDKRLGVSYDYSGRRSGVHALLFGEDLNSDTRHRGVALRAFVNPLRSAGGILHLGVSGVREDISGSTSLRTRPESHVTDTFIVDTGKFDDVETTRRLGVEAAGARGAFSTRLEFLVKEWQREDGSENRFVGAYMEGGYFITGQPFRYLNGKFVRPALAKGDAAWELGYRFSWLNLNDGDVEGGEQRNTGLALNYYPRPNLRGQFNLIYVDAEDSSSDGWLAQARIQVNW